MAELCLFHKQLFALQRPLLAMLVTTFNTQWTWRALGPGGDVQDRTALPGVVSSSVSSSRFVSPGPAPIRNAPKGEGSAQKARRAVVPEPQRHCGESSGSKLTLFFCCEFYVKMLYCRREIQISWLSSYIFKLWQQHICLCFDVFIKTTKYCYFC